MDTSSHSRHASGAQTKLPYIVALAVTISLALGIAGAVGNYVYTSQVEVKRDAQLERLSSIRAQALASKTDLYLRKLVEEITFFASKPRFVDVVQKAGLPALAKGRLSITSQDKNITAIRYVVTGEAKVDSQPSPLPIRYAELDMIKRIESGESVYPEAVKNDNIWRILIAVPAKKATRVGVEAAAAGDIAGVLLVAMNLQGLRDFIVVDEVELTEGLSQVQQVFGRKPSDVLVLGEGQEREFTRVASVADSHWQVSFTPSALLISHVKTPMIIVLCALAMCTALLIGIAVWFGLRTARRFCQLRETKSGAVTLGELMSNDAVHDYYIDPMYQKDSIIDIDLTEENESFMLFEDEEELAPASSVHDPTPIQDTSGGELDRQALAPKEVFRAYDIRGNADTLITTKLAYAVGQAVASEALDKGEDTLIVARDARNHSPSLTEFLIRGILSTGCHVLNIGTVPTPLMYYATETLEETSSGIMVTAGHNAATDNGFKVVMQKQARSSQDISALRQRIVDDAVHHGVGQEHRLDIIERYLESIISDVALAENFTVVIDAGNAVPGVIAPRLFEDLGCNVIPLFCDLNGDFPNHPPDIAEAGNLDALVDAVVKEKADIGLAFDGDGDRLAVVTASGRIVMADQLLILFAVDILSRNPGADVIFDVKCSRHVAQLVSEAGGRPIMWKTGHSPMRLKMVETDALLAGEFSGHIFIKDRWFGFDDGIYAAARLLELLSLQDDTLDDMLDALPQSVVSREYRVPVDEAKKISIVESLKQSGGFDQGLHTTIDGLRVDFPNGWGLVRASNTASCLSMRFEADDEHALREIKVVFDRELRRVDNAIAIEWN